MARLEIRITHVAWRIGRPRFVPGPQLRALGFKGADLRRADGGWMTPEEALAWSQAMDATIAGRRTQAAAAGAGGKRLKPLMVDGRRVMSTEDLIEAWFKEDPKMKPAAAGEDRYVVIGKRRVKRLSPATIASYRHFQKVLGGFDGQIYTGPIESLTQPIVYDLYERLWEERGLANANAVIATLSAAISWGMKRGKIRFAVNPCFKLGRTSLDPRVRCWTPDEVKFFVDFCDRHGRPEIGDAVLLGVWTGQRQRDRLALVDVALVNGRRLFRQSKTGAIVEIREAPQLEARLAAARRRRDDWNVQPLTVICDETPLQRCEFQGSWYRHVFMELRNEAAKTMPSLADATDQDLRDTAVTWLARAGCTLMEICAITGHEPQTAQAILKHYLARHPEMADNAIGKLVAWYDGQI